MYNQKQFFSLTISVKVETILLSVFLDSLDLTFRFSEHSEFYSRSQEKRLDISTLPLDYCRLLKNFMES